MKSFLSNIGIVILAFFVFLLSIGINVTKLTCHEATTITIGDKSLSCNEEPLADNCVDEISAESCCIVENIVSCCSSLIDLCAKELSTLKYDFNTVVSEKENFENNFSLDISFFFRDINFFSSQKITNYPVRPPPTKLRKLRLVEIQSFLI